MKQYIFNNTTIINNTLQIGAYNNTKMLIAPSDLTEEVHVYAVGAHQTFTPEEIAIIQVLNKLPKYKITELLEVMLSNKNCRSPIS